MRTHLQISELAQLLDVTTKTIRHYHKVGLLQEPERTSAGYRLYNAQDVLRLRSIRQLQSLGLSLQQIKQVLGTANQERTLREVLQSLDLELEAQIHLLQARRTRIKQWLESSEDVEEPYQPSPTVQYVVDNLGLYLSQISPELWAMEMKTNALLDSLQWPEMYRETMKKMAHYFVAHPEHYQQLLQLGERLVSLAHLPENTPEIEQMVEECLKYDEILTLLQPQLESLISMETPFATTMTDLVRTTLTPAQQRFLHEVSRRLNYTQSNS